MVPRTKYRLLFLGAALVGATLDLLTKEWAFSSLGGEGYSRPIWPEVFHLTTCTNRGVVWGMFQSGGPVFLILAALAVPVLCVVFFKMRDPSVVSALALGAILAGTIGNLYDRIVHHAVRDFLHFVLIDWPVFNVADAFICVGAFGFAWVLMTTPEPAMTESPPVAAAPPAPPAPADPVGR